MGEHVAVAMHRHIHTLLVEVDFYDGVSPKHMRAAVRQLKAHVERISPCSTGKTDTSS